MSTLLLIAYLVGCMFVLLVWVLLYVKAHTYEEITLGQLLMMIAVTLASWPGLLIAAVALLDGLKVMKIVVFRINKKT